jgi:hypothetical protein
MVLTFDFNRSSPITEDGLAVLSNLLLTHTRILNLIRSFLWMVPLLTIVSEMRLTMLDQDTPELDETWGVADFAVDCSVGYAGAKQFKIGFTHYIQL